MNIYLAIEHETGKFYEYSKTEKEGFEKYTSSKGNTSYRRYYHRGVFGLLQRVSIRKNDFGQQISIYVIDKDKNAVYMQIPLYTQKDAITAYAESFIRVIASLKEQEGYRFFPYAIEKEGSEYKTHGISVKEASVLEEAIYNDVEDLSKLSFSYTDKEGNEVKGDIPPVNWVKKAGKDVLDSTEKDNYLFSVLEQHAHDDRDGFKGTSSVKTVSKNSTKQEPKKEEATASTGKTVSKNAPKKATTVAQGADDDDDDLPF